MSSGRAALRIARSSNYFFTGMHVFRFSLTQLILLLVLVAVLGGLISAASKSRYYLSYADLAVSPDGKIAVAMTRRGFQLIDLQTGSSRTETLTNDWNPVVSFSKKPVRKIVFQDNNTFAFILPVGFQQSMAGVYSIPSSSLISEYVFEDASAINFLNSNGQTLLGNDFICRVPIKGTSIPFFDLKDTASIRFRFEPKMPSAEPNQEHPENTNDESIESGESKSSDKPKKPTRNLIEGRWHVNKDGSRLASMLANEIKIWESKSGNLLAIVPIETDSVEHIFFLDQDRVLLSSWHGYSMHDVSGSTPSLSWEIDFEDLVQVEPEAVFSVDKKFVAVSKRINSFRKQFLVVDSNSGDIVFESPELGAERIGHFVFDEKNDLIVAAENSDAGISNWDFSTGKRNTLLGQMRFPVAILFTLLLIGWAWLWGRIARQSERRCVTQTSEQLAESLAAHPLDTSATISAKQEYSQGIVTDVELVESYDTVRGKKSLEVSWNLMLVGGIVGIAWSVIPMFVFHGSWFFNSFFEQIFPIRACLMIFGVVVGLMALARGIGKFHSLLRLTAGLQLFQMVNFDVINFLFGAIETTMLNRDSALSEIANARSSKRSEP